MQEDNIIITATEQKMSNDSQKRTSSTGITNRIMFVNDKQLQFYRSLETKSGSTDITPGEKKVKQFWEGIWSVEAKHNPRASWIGKVRTKMGTDQQQEDLSITTVEDVRSVLKRSLTGIQQDLMEFEVFRLKTFKTYMKK